MPPLQKQFYRVNFGQGLDTKTDVKVLSSGKMVVLQNAQFTIANRLSKRNGFSAVGAVDSAGDSIQRLADFDGAVIGWGEPTATTILSGTWNGTSTPWRGVYTYNQSTTIPTFAPAFPAFNNCLVTTKQITVSQAQSQSQGDSASVGGFTLFAWLGTATSATTSQVYYKIINSSTGQIVVSSRVGASINPTLNYSSVRCVASGTYLLVGAVVSPELGGSVIIDSYNTANGLAHTGGSVTGTMPANAAIWDWAPYTVAGTARVVVANNSGAQQLKFTWLSSAASTITSVTTNISTTATQLCMIQPCPSTTSAVFRCVYTDAAANLSYVPVTPSGNNITIGSISAGTDGGTMTYPAYNIVGQELSDLTNCRLVAANSSNTASPVLNSKMYMYGVNSSGTWSNLGRSGSLAYATLAPSSKMIWVDDNNLYMWTLYPSKIQGQYILLHWMLTPNLATGDAISYSWLPAARVMAGQAMGPSSGKHPLLATNINYLGSSKYETSCIAIGQQYTDTTGVVQLPALSNIHMDFNFTNALHTVTLNNQMIVAGGFNALYDGTSITELGFFIYPEGASAVVSTTNGSLSVGTYQYVLTYEWTDNLDNLHRSETSVPLTVTTSNTTNNAVTLTVPQLNPTLKDSDRNTRSYSTIGIYRTTATASPAVYYRVGSVSNSTPGSLNTTYIDTSADTAITSSSILYTQGGVLDNYTIDGTAVIAANSTQLFASDPNNNGIVRIGKGYTQTVGLAFFSGITSLLPTADGPITCMLWMDNSLIIFKARSIYYMSGIGPTDNGQNNQLSQIQLLTNDVGCDGPHGACLYPDGILFKSAKGYYRLGHDLSFGPENYIGAAVESFNSYSCLRAICAPDLNRCRFALSDNVTILEYDYYFKQWSYIITSVNDMARLDGSFYIASHTPSIGALVGLETVGTFVDALTSPTGIPFIITTGWIALNQLQGAQRIYRIRFLGDFKSTHTVTVELNYDYESAFAETHTLTSANITTGSSAYQFEVFPLRQKCESIQIRIKDGTPTGESFDLTDMEVEVGLLPGRRFPLAAAKGN